MEQGIVRVRVALCHDPLRFSLRSRDLWKTISSFYCVFYWFFSVYSYCLMYLLNYLRSNRLKLYSCTLNWEQLFWASTDIRKGKEQLTNEILGYTPAHLIESSYYEQVRNSESKALNHSLQQQRESDILSDSPLLLASKFSLCAFYGSSPDITCVDQLGQV
jgi:hypothetical protein